MNVEQAVVRMSARAMATEFEIALWGRDRRYLETVGEQAFAEIHRLERQLSLYRDDSDIAYLNARASHSPVPVDPRLFHLLQLAEKLSAETGGAFDITIAPLMAAWGFMGDSGGMADAAKVAAARECVGMDLIELDEGAVAVRFLREGVTIDLGAIGKGYAIEQAAALVRELGVAGGLLHGGTSTVQAIGPQPNGLPWNVAVADPGGMGQPLRTIPLQDAALSVSAVHGKYFDEGGQRYGHVLDPRTGAPTKNAILSAVTCPSATASDALSTALLVAGEPLLQTIASRPDTGAMVACGRPDDVHTFEYNLP